MQPLITISFLKKIQKNIFLFQLVIKKLDFLGGIDVLLAISQYTEKQTLDVFPERVVVNISGAPDKIFSPVPENATLSFPDITKEFILYIGGLDEHKNVIMLINAFGRLSASNRNNYQLVILCSKFNIRKDIIRQNFNDAGLSSEEYVQMEFLSDNDLVWLYSHCKFFCFPALSAGSAFHLSNRCVAMRRL